MPPAPASTRHTATTAPHGVPWVELDVGEALIATGVAVCEGVGGGVEDGAELGPGDGERVVALLAGRVGGWLAVVVVDAARVAVAVVRVEVAARAVVGAAGCRVVAVVVVLVVVAVRVGAAVLVAEVGAALGGGVHVGRTPLPNVQARTSPGLG